MGFIDKIKDLFTDEEEVYETKEIEIENEEEEDKLPTFMRNKIEKEETEERKKQERQEQEEKEIAVQIDTKPVNPIKEKKNLSFEFNDEDFVDVTRFSRSTVQKEKQIQDFKEKEVVPVIKPYSNKKEIDKPKKFKPTPVISPVYGILDKNYRTEEVVSKEDDGSAIQRASKKVDFESVRKKAYGTLSDDITANLCENCELLKEIKVSKKIERLTEEDLLYNITTEAEEEDMPKVNLENLEEEQEYKYDENITLGEATENYDDFGVTYEVPPQRERKHDSAEVKIVNHAETEVVVEKVEVKEEKVVDEVNRQKDLELTDDLFNLIDSMYKERDD